KEKRKERKREKQELYCKPRPIPPSHSEPVEEQEEKEEAEKKEKEKREEEKKEDEKKAREEERVVPPVKVATLHEDGTPLFDASETERETESDDEDSGGVTIDESEWDDEQYFLGDDYPTDSDSECPKLNDSNETLVDEEPSGPVDMRWTSDDDEAEVDAETQGGIRDGLNEDYEGQGGDYQWKDEETLMESREVKEDEERGGHDSDVD
ncbi:hypothetical protein PENTCL1PPCAC_13876, partial [Pristionchus entomophagus]